MNAKCMPAPPEIVNSALSLGTIGERSSLGYAARFTKNCNPNLYNYQDLQSEILTIKPLPALKVPYRQCNLLLN